MVIAVRVSSSLRDHMVQEKFCETSSRKGKTLNEIKLCFIKNSNRKRNIIFILNSYSNMVKTKLLLFSNKSNLLHLKLVIKQQQHHVHSLTTFALSLFLFLCFFLSLHKTKLQYHKKSKVNKSECLLPQNSDENFIVKR